jgi:hypothetical protein
MRCVPAEHLAVDLISADHLNDIFAVSQPCEPLQGF